MEIEKKTYTFKFFNLNINNKNESKYEDYFNVNHSAVRNCIIYYLRERQGFTVDDDKIGILSCVQSTNDYFLGKYSIAYNRDCNYTENLKYSNLNIEPNKETGTSCYTYFYIDFKSNKLIFLQRADIKAFTTTINKALRNSISIKFDVEKDWKQRLAEKFTYIKTLEIRYFDENENKKFMQSITKLGDITHEAYFDFVALNLKRMNTKRFIKKLSQLNVRDFDKLDLWGVDDKGQNQKFDCINQIIQKKLNIELNEDEISESKIVETFKKLV